MTLRKLIGFFIRELWKLIRIAKSWPSNFVVLCFALFVLLFAFIDIHFGILPR
jgi:hypothetical protein